MTPEEKKMIEESVQKIIDYLNHIEIDDAVVEKPWSSPFIDCDKRDELMGNKIEKILLKQTRKAEKRGVKKFVEKVKGKRLNTISSDYFSGQKSIIDDIIKLAQD